jgi:hypothetical protein
MAQDSQVRMATQQCMSLQVFNIRARGCWYYSLSICWSEIAVKLVLTASHDVAIVATNHVLQEYEGACFL